MNIKPLALVLVLLAHLIVCLQSLGQSNTAEVMQKLQAAENKARQQGRIGSIKPNVADIVLNKSKIPSSRTGPVIATVLASTVKGGQDAKETPIPTAGDRPGGLVVFIDAEYPPTSNCRWSVPPDGLKHFPPEGCNDTASTVDVPIGMTAKICETDGGGGYGVCRDYGAGISFVGGDLNDKGTSFWANDQGSYFYLTTADDEVPLGLDIGVTYSGTTDGTNGRISVTLNVSRDWYTKTYSIPLPNWCAHPNVFESTKANQADWKSTVSSGVLNVELRVRKRLPLSSNNWVGVGVRCYP